MTTRYTAKQIEDVAAILSGATRYSGKDDDGEYFVSVDPDEVRQAFERLFAAGNACFDREQFLVACGLEGN